MIQVTLSFKSIDAAIQALRGLLEADIAMGTVRDAPAPAKPKAEDPKVQAASPAATPAVASASAAKPEAASTPATEPDLSGEEGYKVLKDAVFALAGKSRDAALAVNAKFGVKTMKDLPEAKRGEALQAVNASIAALTKTTEVA